jgi:hypothetical protein
MTYTIPKIRELLDTEGLRYYLIPDREGVMLSLSGSHGRFQFHILLEEEGEFLQFRSIEYLYCPKDHPNLDATLQVLGELNYRLRLMKFGWDPTDGEIAVYADLWIMDAEITDAQFSRMIQGYMSIVDEKYPMIQEAIQSGVKPSEDSGEDEEETISSL